MIDSIVRLSTLEINEAYKEFLKISYMNNNKQKNQWTSDLKIFYGVLGEIAHNKIIEKGKMKNKIKKDVTKKYYTQEEYENLPKEVKDDLNYDVHLINDVKISIKTVYYDNGRIKIPAKQYFHHKSDLYILMKIIIDYNIDTFEDFFMYINKQGYLEVAFDGICSFYRFDKNKTFIKKGSTPSAKSSFYELKNKYILGDVNDYIMYLSSILCS